MPGLLEHRERRAGTSLTSDDGCKFATYDTEMIEDRRKFPESKAFVLCFLDRRLVLCGSASHPVRRASRQADAVGPLLEIMRARCILGRMLGLVGSLAFAGPVTASEFGISTYVLGLGLPLSGITPPPGIYFRDMFYLYRGSFAPGGRRTYNIMADIGTLAWYPDLRILGGSPGFSAVVPYVGLRSRHQSTVVGNDGSSRLDETLGTANSLGDTYYSAMLGWHSGESHWTVFVTAFMPTGYYVPHQLGITGLNRPAIDVTGAFTYLGAETGLELTALLGMTANAPNTATSYQSGTEFHFEWAVQQHLPIGLYAGAVGYIYQQVTDDTGAGATYGPFRGRAFGIGPSIGYTIEVDGRQINFAGRWYHEFLVQNRPAGDAIYASLGLRF